MEIAASVCEGLNKMMLDDKEFATLVTMTLGPHFMFLVLANWEELSDSVPKGAYICRQLLNARDLVLLLVYWAVAL